MLERHPLKKADGPSSLYIFLKQSQVPVYITSAPFLPEVIMSLLLTVSNGYEMTPAPTVTN